MNVKIVNKSKFELPSYATLNSAGMDLRANIDEDVILKPLERALIPTGIFISLPPNYDIKQRNYEAQIRPRSGLALKHGITVLNTPGTIDADYRGEIGVILVNLSFDEFTIKSGDRIAQMVVSSCETIEWEQVEILEQTERGGGGFGHTGTK